jgi:hypothetical protein
VILSLLEEMMWSPSRFRRDFWEPAWRDLLGDYPRGHPYHQDNPLIRYYALAVTIFVVAVIVVSLLFGLFSR